jgi:hypothetical protein
MLRGLNSLFRKEPGLKYQYTVSVHSLTLASNLPWHSDKVWFHQNAKECISIPESCRELMIVWKCGTKLAATKIVEFNPDSVQQVVWGQELGMICTLLKMKSKSSTAVDQVKCAFRPKKSKFKLHWRGIINKKSDQGVKSGPAYVSSQPLGQWKLLATGRLDLGRLAGSDDRHETVELELRDWQEKPLGILHLSVSSRCAAGVRTKRIFEPASARSGSPASARSGRSSPFIACIVPTNVDIFVRPYYRAAQPESLSRRCAAGRSFEGSTGLHIATRCCSPARAAPEHRLARLSGSGAGGSRARGPALPTRSLAPKRSPPTAPPATTRRSSTRTPRCPSGPPVPVPESTVARLPEIVLLVNPLQARSSQQLQALIFIANAQQACWTANTRFPR